MKLFNILIIFLFIPFQISTNDNFLEKDLVIEDEILKFANSTLKLNVDSNGKILVTNTDLNEIYLYSKKGKRKKKISREGRGPGEFISIGDTYINSDNVFYVLDQEMRKVSSFSSPDYDVSDEFKISIKTIYQRPEELYVSSRNKYLVAFSDVLSLQNPKQGKNNLYSVVNGETTNKLILSYQDDQMFVYTNNDQITTSLVPYGYESELKMGPNSMLYWGKTDRDYIQIYNKSGSKQKKIEIVYDPVSVPAKDIQKFKDFASSNKRGSIFFKNLLEANVIPEILPVFDWFLVDDLNRVWVAVNTDNKNKYTLKIYDSNGAKMVETSLPKQVELQVVRDGYAYGVQEDKNGFQSVIRYKINEL